MDITDLLNYISDIDTILYYSECELKKGNIELAEWYLSEAQTKIKCINLKEIAIHFTQKMNALKTKN